MKSDISNAQDELLRVSMIALKRASKVARETAIQTETDLIVVEEGKLLRISAEELRAQPDSAKP
ncbi:MAG: hypothetical protein EOL86_05480 [Deltaproteobacteria bacterium]|nr:hypothetical protein [Deltaproteobacteria bacterium]